MADNDHIKFYPGYSAQKIAVWNKPTDKARAADRALVLDRTSLNEMRVERLVRAIDSHDALVKALTTLIDAIDFEGEHGSVRFNPGGAYEDDRLKAARIALADATGIPA